MLATDQPRRVLPADVYDALELSAEAYGGIGRGSYYVTSYADPAFPVPVPCCVIGHGWFVDPSHEVEGAMNRVGINESTSDVAVTIVLNGHLGRITFAEWCQALNVVRGE